MSDTGTMRMPGIDFKSNYAQSFGALPDRTVICGGGANDMRPLLKAKLDEGFKSFQTKALNTTTGGVGTAGNALIPVFVDQRIVDQSRKETPLTEVIPRVTNFGITADFNVVTEKGAAFTAAQDASLDEANDTFKRESTPIKFLYAVGRTTGQAQAAFPSYMLEGFQPSGTALPGAGGAFANANAPNAMQIEVLLKARSIKEKEEDLIINGDASVTSTEFSGIVKLQGTTNVTDLTGNALTLDDIEDTVELAYEQGGRPKLAVASPSVMTDIRKLLRDTIRWPLLPGTGVIDFGVPVSVVLNTMVGPIPVIPSRFLSNVAAQRSIYFLDTDYIEMRVLLDMTFERLAKTNDSDKFMLKIYEALIFRAPNFNSFIDNIA